MQGTPSSSTNYLGLSITSGTPVASAPLSAIPIASLNTVPLDLRTHISTSFRNSPSPSTSPALQIIKEENNFCGRSHENISDNLTVSSRPQISLTDEMGDEVTLVPYHNKNISDDMVLDTVTSPYTIPSFVISGPCDPSLPSIVRGIGKKKEHQGNYINEHSEIETKTNVLTGEERRESYAQTKNIGLRHTFPFDYKSTNSNRSRSSDIFDSDSLSNDSLEYSTDKSGQIFSSELVEKTSSGSFLVCLSDNCSDLNSNDILTIIKQIIDVKAPPKCFLFSNVSEDLESNKLSLEYPGGVQIELKIYEKIGCDQKSLKLRRISGDQNKYSQVCQQLISCITV